MTKSSKGQLACLKEIVVDSVDSDVDTALDNLLDTELDNILEDKK